MLLESNGNEKWELGSGGLLIRSCHLTLTLSSYYGLLTTDCCFFFLFPFPFSFPFSLHLSLSSSSSPSLFLLLACSLFFASFHPAFHLLFFYLLLKETKYEARRGSETKWTWSRKERTKRTRNDATNWYITLHVESSCSPLSAYFFFFLCGCHPCILFTVRCWTLVTVFSSASSRISFCFNNSSGRGGERGIARDKEKGEDAFLGGKERRMKKRDTLIQYTLQYILCVILVKEAKLLTGILKGSFCLFFACVFCASSFPFLFLLSLYVCVLSFSRFSVYNKASKV